MSKHYIYEIKGVKIGCTKNLEARIELYKGKYKLEDLKIIEVLQNKTDKEAGEREREYQQRLGYKVDKCSYTNSVKAQKTRLKGRIKSNKKLGIGICNNKNLQVKGGKVSIEKQREKKTGPFAKTKCKYCNMITIKTNIIRWHNEKCRNKKENEL